MDTSTTPPPPSPPGVCEFYAETKENLDDDVVGKYESRTKLKFKT